MDASSRRERIAEEAAEWWVTLQGEVTRAEREQYVDWLRESGLHVAEMLRIAQVHGALKLFQRWSKLPTDGSGADEQAVVPLPNSEPTEPARDTPNRSVRRLTFALAAVVAFAAIGLTVFLMGRHGQAIETARGERREVSLADGSVVQVDPETRLRVEYEPTRRLVFLERGRALFHVAKNKERPFLVTADGTTVRAVGTAFAVDKESESVVVTVAEGRVAVEPTAPHSPVRVASGIGSPARGSATVARDGRRPLSASATEAGAPDASSASSAGARSDSSPVSTAPEILVSAGEQLVVDAVGDAEPVRHVDPSHALAWADGRLVFDNDSVEHVVEEFNRYNRIQLEVRDLNLAKRPISGTFSAADPESFIAFLETVAAVQVSKDEEGNTIITSSK